MEKNNLEGYLISKKLEYASHLKMENVLDPPTNATTPTARPN